MTHKCIKAYFYCGELYKAIGLVSARYIVLYQDTVDNVAKRTENLSQIILNNRRVDIGNVQNWLIF